jgi:hypothetical protein
MLQDNLQMPCGRTKLSGASDAQKNPNIIPVHFNPEFQHQARRLSHFLLRHQSTVQSLF